MQRIFERLLFLIEFFENKNQTQFARKIGCPQTTLNGYLNLKGQEKIKVSFLEKILKSYPEISKEWLYFGYEPIFIKDKNYKLNLSQDEIEALQQENERLKQELAEADRINRKLTARIFVDGVNNEKSADAASAKAVGQQ